mmetsp:Transcript_13635/g.27180  ORF Transcript_13635/g.27180 Transcript_13635/m.27180 type:complete len:224 (-) Transcript_13635:847-1518(-)
MYSIFVPKISVIFRRAVRYVLFRSVELPQRPHVLPLDGGVHPLTCLWVNVGVYQRRQRPELSTRDHEGRVEHGPKHHLGARWLRESAPVPVPVDGRPDVVGEGSGTGCRFPSSGGIGGPAKLFFEQACVHLKPRFPNIEAPSIVFAEASSTPLLVLLRVDVGHLLKIIEPVGVWIDILYASVAVASDALHCLPEGFEVCLEPEVNLVAGGVKQHGHCRELPLM